MAKTKMSARSLDGLKREGLCMIMQLYIYIYIAYSYSYSYEMNLDAIL